VEGRGRDRGRRGVERDCVCERGGRERKRGGVDKEYVSV
jgi:hypothetical protein